MSNNQPPGPYGQPPQGPPPGGGPNPYAQGGGAPGAPGAPGSPAPGYGYPQQPGQAPPPPPGAPAGAPGAPQPGPYGQPPFGGAPGQPPGQGGNKNRTTLIVIASIVAVALIGGLVFFLTSGGDDDENDNAQGENSENNENNQNNENNGNGEDNAGDGTDEGANGGAPPAGPSYALSFPQQSGEFQQMAESPGFGEPSDEELRRLGLGDVESDEAQYLTSDPGRFANTGMWDDGSVLSGALGLWGQIDNPDATVSAMFGLAEEQLGQGMNAGAELQGSPVDLSDGEVSLQCQIANGTEPDPLLGYVQETTVCVWADHSTMGMVYYSPLPDLPSDFDPMDEDPPTFVAPDPVSIEQAGEYTRQLRADSLVNAG